MKKLRILVFILAASIGFYSCIKNDPVTFVSSTVEFDAAAYNSNTAYMLPPDSIAFPLLTKKPPFGRAVVSADPNLTRTSGTVRLRVNRIGGTSKVPAEVSYRVVNINEYKLVGVEINPNEQAIAGTHYTALPGKTTIPADSSWGYIDVQILDAGASTPPRELVLMLTDSPDAKASRNYKTVGLRITQ